MHTYSKIIVFLFIFTSITLLLFYFFIPIHPVSQLETDEAYLDPTDNIVLDYYIWDDETSYIRPVVDAYMAFHKNVHINLHPLKSLNYDSEVQNLLASGTKMDLIGIRGISLIVQMKEREQLLDITDRIRGNNFDVTVYGNMYNNLSIGGKYFALPTRSTCWFLLYNKELFDEAGLPYPTEMTWDEYGALAQRLTDVTGQEKTYGGCWPPWFFNFGGIQRSSYLIDDDLTYTRESLELLNKFYNVDHSHMSYNEMLNNPNGDMDFTQLFESGHIAMMPQGEWMVNMLLEYEKLHTDCVRWDIAPMPVFKGQEPNVTWGQYQFAAITSNTPYPEESYNFLEFLCGEEGARIFAEHGMIHAYCTDEIKKIYLDVVGKDSAAYFFEAKRVQEELSVPNYQTLYAQFKEIAAQYLLEKITIDEAMRQLQQVRAGIYGYGVDSKDVDHP